MQEAINLVSNEALFVLGATLLAMLCALPGFVIDLFYDISKYKKYIFLANACALAVIMALKNNKNSEIFGEFFINALLDLGVVYFGLLILIALKNMATRAGMCKICDKIKSRLRRG